MPKKSRALCTSTQTYGSEDFFGAVLSRESFSTFPDPTGNSARETLVILSSELAALDGEHGRGILAGEQRFTFVERVFVAFTR